MIGNGDELTEEHESVQQVKLANQQPLLGTLDECLQLYMQEERVSRHPPPKAFHSVAYAIVLSFHKMRVYYVPIVA
jgi:hypothetical protein